MRQKNKLRGVLHCFSSSERLAMVAIDLGQVYHSPVLLHLKMLVQYEIYFEEFQMIGYLLRQTTFLAPCLIAERNEPSYITKIVDKISEVKQLPIAEVINLTTKNSLKFLIRLKYEKK